MLARVTTLLMGALCLLSSAMSAQTFVQDSVGTNGVQDSTKTSHTYKLRTSGVISLGFDYGVIPFLVDSNYPSGYYKTEGNVNIEAFGLPVTASYYYSDARTVTGLNNYVRFSFDEKRYKENIRKKASLKHKEAQDKLTELSKAKQFAMQKLLFLESIDQYASLPVDTAFINEAARKQAEKEINDWKDSLQAQTSAQQLTDSASNIYSTYESYSNVNTDSLQHALSGHYQDSLMSVLNPYAKYAGKADSISGEIDIYREKVSQLEAQINHAQAMLKVLENPEQSIKQQIPGFPFNRTEQFMYYIKKLDVGLCYPSYSTFLVSSAPVKGVNLELEKNKLFVAFTHGTTINNLLFSNNLIHNKLQNVRNLYNFFDFNNIEAGRKITVVKAGYGTREGSHLHVGLLYGKGKTSYFHEPDPVSSLATEKNYVIELDGRFKINESNTLDLIYGRSLLQQSGYIYANNENSFQSIFSSGIRSNAALARFTSQVKHTGTRIMLTGRLIDPFFKSYGVGFMRSDNFRYELKADQKLSKKIKVGGHYRREEDNLLSLYTVSTVLNTFGVNINIRFNRHLSIRADYNPVVQKVNSKDNSISLNNRNNISNTILTWTPKSKKVFTSLNAIYSYYQLYDGTRNNIFQNAGLIHTLQFKAPVRSNFSLSWFDAESIDSIAGSTLVATEEIGYTGKKGFAVNIAGKLATSEKIKQQWGYSVRVNVPLFKPFSMEGGFERLVIGDFYSTYDFIKIQDFPYYTYIKLNCNW